MFSLLNKKNLPLFVTIQKKEEITNHNKKAKRMHSLCRTLSILSKCHFLFGKGGLQKQKYNKTKKCCCFTCLDFSEWNQQTFLKL